MEEKKTNETSNIEKNEETTSEASSEQDFAPRIDLEPFRRVYDRIREESAKVIVGQEKVIEMMFAAILCNGHVLLEGAPGVAKTLIAKLMARLIDVDFGRVQFTPDLMPSDLIGTSVFNQKTVNFELRKGPIFTNVLLVDEINRSPAKTQAALFEVMEERQATIDGVTHKVAEPFVTFATQNPIEQEGTYRLPEAQIDRFLFKLIVDYPDVEEETDILLMKHDNINHTDLSKIEKVVGSEEIIKLRALAHSVRVEKDVMFYISKISSQTRNNPDIYLGASPRASIAMLAAAKAVALFAGRDFATPDDVREVAPPVLRHRLILSPEKEMEGSTPDDVIKDVLNSVEAPR